MKTKPDWKNIKQIYLNDEGTLRELAERFGVCFSTIGKRAKRERWFEQQKAIKAKFFQELKAGPMAAAIELNPLLPESVNTTQMFGTLIHDLTNLGERLQRELMKNAQDEELDCKTLQRIAALSKTLRDVTGSVSQLREVSAFNSRTRRLIRPEVMDQARARAPVLPSLESRD